jgi:hypothetical protein
MRKTPLLRLAFGPMFWRLFLILVILAEVGLWTRLQPFLKKRDTRFQVAAMILHSPKRVFRSFAWAALATVIADGYVRLVLRPVMGRWYSPRRRDVGFGTPLEFLLSSNERVVGEVPGRWVVGRCTEPGRLIKTDRRVLFCPEAWDAEPWSVGDSDVVDVFTTPAKIRFGSLILGTPDRVSLRSADGTESRFVVADPEDVISLFPERLIRTTNQDAHRPSPLELL